MSSRNWLLLVLLSCLWGSSFFFTEVLLESWTPLQVVLVRTGFSAAVLLLFCLGFRVALPHRLRPWAALFVMALLANSLPFLLIAIGQKTTTGGVASILNASTAFFAVIVAAIFLRDEPLSLNRIVGILIGLIGVSITIGYEAIFEFSLYNAGQWLIVIATLFYALSNAWGRRTLDGIDSTAAATGMSICAFIQMLVTCYFARQLYILPVDIPIILSAFSLGVFNSAFAFIVYFHLLRSAGAGNVALCTMLIPVIAIILDATILSQLIQPHQFLGFIVILAGLLVLDGRLALKLRMLLQA